MRELGLPDDAPTDVIRAYQRAAEIRQQTYDGASCTVTLEDAGDQWQIRVTRVADGAETLALVPKLGG